MFYLGSTYRNSNEFVNWSKATVIASFASLLFLPLVAFYQFVGVCARYSLPGLFSMLYAHLRRPLKIRPRFDFKVLREMMAFGAPLMIFAYISTNLWTAIERSYILKMLDAEMLGVFTFAGTLCLALTTVATSISQVFNPRIAILYGSSGKCLPTTLRYCVKCSLVGFAVMLPLVVLTFWVIDPLVSYFLPKYIKSIAITRCLCWLSLIPVLDLPKQLLMVAKRTRQFGISVLMSFGVFLAVLALLAWKNETIALESIAIASVACKMLSVAISYGLCWNAAFHEKNRPSEQTGVRAA
jgi:O-antigen/teichoic acid export membrane protein